MEQENKSLDEANQIKETTSQVDETSKTQEINSEPAKDELSKNQNNQVESDIASIDSDNLGTSADENVLKSIGINYKQESENIHSDIKRKMESDLQNIDMLVQYGMLDSKLGRNLKKNILQKAFDNVVRLEKSRSVKQEKSKIFEEFKKNSNDFFKYDGRRDVLNYLQNEVSEIGLNDLTRISEIVEIVEKSAINRYLAKISHDKSLKDANEQAKQKLKANAQQSSDGVNLAQTFTRAQIGKMSRKEFEKYEKAIMKQLREGKIK